MHVDLVLNVVLKQYFFSFPLRFFLKVSLYPQSSGRKAVLFFMKKEIILMLALSGQRRRWR